MNFFQLSVTVVPILLRGLKFTIYIATYSLFLALFIGLIGGIFNKNSKVFIIRILNTLYIYIIRGTPFLIQLYAVFFILPQIGIILTPTQAAIYTLALHNGAYIAEIVRSGIEAIPKEQHDAAVSLGMTPFLTMKLVILPQVIRLIIPPLVGQILVLIKDTSLTSLIGFFELTKTGRELTVAARFNPVIVYAYVSFFYFMICYPLYIASNKLEKKLRLNYTD